MRELRAVVGHETTAVLGRCVAYGQGVTYRPLANIVRGLGDGDPRSTLLELLDDDERADVVTSRVLGAIGPAEGAVLPEETSWAVRRLFEALARERPLIAVFEDLPWAEPTLLGLLEYVSGVLEWLPDPAALLGAPGAARTPTGVGRSDESPDARPRTAADSRRTSSSPHCSEPSSFESRR